MRSIALIAAVTLYFGSALAADATPANDAERAYFSYLEATRTGNLAALDRIVADDYMATNGRGKLAGKRDELNEAKGNPHFTNLQAEELHSLVVGNTAVVTGVIAATYTGPAGQPIKIRVRELATLLKRHGRWRLIADESAPLHSSTS